MLNSDSETIICKHAEFYYSCGMLHPVTSGSKNEKLQLIAIRTRVRFQVRLPGQAREGYDIGINLGFEKNFLS